GHQEIKLTADGLTDDRLAALDADWSEFTAAERAAFELTRKLTYEPFALADADLDGLRKHYQDIQILEIIFTVANNNATNRWTVSLGTPRDRGGAALRRAVGKARGESRTSLPPPAARYKDRPSRVAAVRRGQPAGPAVPAKRPPLEGRAEVEAALAACRSRT